MALSLNHQQRLNLVTVLGAQDIRGREAHAVWHLQDTLDLNDEEKRQIEFQAQTINGNEVKFWNMEKTLPERTFDLSESDIERIRKAVEEFPQFKSWRDRVWLEPLLAQLQPAATPNGRTGGDFYKSVEGSEFAK